MVMGAFIPGLRRKYPLHEYVSAVLLVVGLILFTLADAQTSPNFSVIGVMMVSGALVMDAFLGNLQEAIFTMNPETTQVRIGYIFSSCILCFISRRSDLKLFVFPQTEMLFCSTLVGMPFLIPPMVFTGELFKAWDSCSKVYRSRNFIYYYDERELLVFHKFVTWLYDSAASLCLRSSGFRSHGHLHRASVGPLPHRPFRSSHHRNGT